MSKEETAQAILYLKKRTEYRSDPLLYFRERLSIRAESVDWNLLPEYAAHKWDGTPNPFRTILELLAAGNWIGVESGTGVGKTFIGAAIVLWWLENFDRSLVVTVAPKEKQLELHIWKEMQKLHPNFGKGVLSRLRLQMRKGNDDWQAVGFVAGVKASEQQLSASKARGFHAEHLLIILEETTGINPSVIQAFMDTADAPHNILIAFGNPDHELDALHKFCGLPHVKPIRISQYDHPNVVLDNPQFVAGAATKIGIERKLQSYKSETNPLFLSKVRGISPKQSQFSLIRLEWLYRAAELWNDPEQREKHIGEKAMGVDVANSVDGDPAAICEGAGSICTSIEAFRCPDANELGSLVFLRMREKGIKQEAVGVDGIGVGAGTVNKLKELNKEVLNIQSSEKPVESYTNGMKDEEEFNNLRSQMHWKARKDLQDERILIAPDPLSGLVDEELLSDLVAPHWTTKNGKIVVESKDDIKKRLGRSTNKGDAFVYWNWTRDKMNSQAASRSSETSEQGSILHAASAEAEATIHFAQERTW